MFANKATLTHTVYEPALFGEFVNVVNTWGQQVRQLHNITDTI